MGKDKIFLDSGKVVEDSMTRFWKKQKKREQDRQKERLKQIKQTNQNVEKPVNDSNQSQNDIHDPKYSLKVIDQAKNGKIKVPGYSAGTFTAQQIQANQQMQEKRKQFLELQRLKQQQKDELIKQRKEMGLDEIPHTDLEQDKNIAYLKSLEAQQKSQPNQQPNKGEADPFMQTTLDQDYDPINQRLDFIQSQLAPKVGAAESVQQKGLIGPIIPQLPQQPSNMPQLPELPQLPQLPQLPPLPSNFENTSSSVISQMSQFIVQEPQNQELLQQKIEIVIQKESTLKKNTVDYSQISQQIFIPRQLVSKDLNDNIQLQNTQSVLHTPQPPPPPPPPPSYPEQKAPSTDLESLYNSFLQDIKK